MQISPPFLAPQANHTDDQSYIAACMPLVEGEGNFPLAGHLCWHNGVHLQAPRDNDRAVPVRAIADGTVKFVQRPVTKNNSLDDPLNYNPWDLSRPAWTDTGMVVLEHKFQLSTDNDAKSFVFYSTYMHLSALDPHLPAVGSSIKRKALLGQPGQIYGSATQQIHFEICCNTDNLKALIGRKPSDVFANPPASDGQTDWFFGSTLIYLPATTPISKEEPATHIKEEANTTSTSANTHTAKSNGTDAQASTSAGASSAPSASAGVDTQSTLPSASDAITPSTPTTSTANATENTLGKAMWVQITYESGNATIASFDANTDIPTPIGKPLLVSQGEYKLYREAQKRHQSLSNDAKLTSSIDGWYQLLRFGRVLGTAPLPAKARHWRQIPTADGNVWADLNADGTHKFSEADFVPTFGWNFIDDDKNHEDQRCESVRLKAMIADPQSKDTSDPDKLMQRVITDAGGIRSRLKRVLCQFATEWVKDTIQERCSWIKHEPEFQENPENWTKLLDHLQATSTTGLPDEYVKADWNWHPLEFIRLMRTFTISKGVIDIWDDACSSHVLPDDSELTETGKMALYVYGLRSSKAAVTDHQGHESFNALSTFNSTDVNNRTTIFGLRVPLTNATFIVANGTYDDRVTVLTLDDTYVINLIYRDRYTTEPTARYAPRAAGFVSDDGERVKGDHEKDLGRLIGDQTYEYAPGVSGRADLGGHRFGQNRFNILKKTVSSAIERLVPNSLLETPPRQFNTSKDGPHLNLNNASWVTGTEHGFYEGQTIHFHRGWHTMTGSAGCQTFPHALGNENNSETSDFDKFMNCLEPMTAASRFQYALKSL